MLLGVHVVEMRPSNRAAVQGTLWPENVVLIRDAAFHAARRWGSADGIQDLPDIEG